MSSDRAERVLTAVLVLAFLVGGSIKFLGGEAVAESFRGWGYPVWFAYVVGVAELAGAAGLLLDEVEALGASLRFWAAVLLAALMAGAAATHLRHGEAGMLALSGSLLVAASALALRVRPESLEVRW